MSDLDYTAIQEAVTCLRQGEVIAYPTESTYGLGCDPFNVDAISQLLQVKQRSIDKGFILIASDWNQLESLVEPIEPRLLAHVFDSWPGPYTWVFPILKSTPYWLSGKYNNLAVRVTAHPIAKMLCELFDGPIVSTSANLSNTPPARDYRTTEMTFANKVAYIIRGKVGNNIHPTQIRDAITGEILRAK